MSTEKRLRPRTMPAPPAGWQVGALGTSVQILLVIAALVAALWVLHRIEGVLLVLALSVLFAYLVAPVVEFFRRPAARIVPGRALPLPLAIFAAYLVIFGAAVGAILLLLPVLNAQLAEFRSELPGYPGGTARDRSWCRLAHGDGIPVPRPRRCRLPGRSSDLAGLRD